MFIAMMMIFSACDWRRFKTKFSMPDVTACVSDISANAKIRAGENHCCDSQRNRAARKFQFRSDGNGRERCHHIEDVDQLLAAAHVLIEPFVAGGIGHRFDAIVTGFAVLIDRPGRDARKNY